MNIGVVEVTTKLGEQFRFPGMDLDAFAVILPKGNRLPSSTAMTFVNASFCVLSLPVHIVKSVHLNGEAWWDCPA